METINYSKIKYPKLPDMYIIKELNDKIGSTYITNPPSVVSLLKEIFEHLDFQREHFISIALNTKNNLNAIDIISIGCLNANIVHPREVFYSAIAHRAANIITAHNHPSGDPNPSKDDVSIVKKLTQGGRILGIQHFDHIIFGGEKWISMNEQGLMGNND